MGIVYRATRTQDGEAVALKLLKQELSDNEMFVRRFLREARVAADVQHPHLVTVLDAGETAGRHYVAGGYIEGGTLRRRLDADGPLTQAELRRLARHIGHALDAIHEAGLVHRDVKPENMMLTPDGSAILVDFGLAKGPAYTVLTRPGQIMGTPRYLAPELINGEEGTPHSDLYAFACVLYEAHTGRPPYQQTNLFELVTAHLEHDPPDPRGDRPDTPDQLAAVLQTALAKRPAERPASGRMLASMVALGTR